MVDICGGGGENNIKRLLTRNPMPTVEYWIQLEHHKWDLSPSNIDRITGHDIMQITGKAPVDLELTSPITGVVRTVRMYKPLRKADTIVDALVLRRYTPNWAAPDDRKVNPWDLNERNPTDTGTMGTIPGPVIECNIGDNVVVHFRNRDFRTKRDPIEPIDIILPIQSRTHSLHPHGFVFKNTSDGAYPLSPPDPTQPVGAEAMLWSSVGVTDFKKGDRVPPGGTFNYTWETLAWPTTAGVWLYHDHSICDMENVQLGSIGIIVIHNPQDPEDVIDPDLPGGSAINSPVIVRCFPFPFPVPVLPHDLNRLGFEAHPMHEDEMLMEGDGEGHTDSYTESRSDTRRKEKNEEKHVGFLIKRGDLQFELGHDLDIIKRICIRIYRNPPGKAQYLQLFHNLGDDGMCINGRKYMGNTPTIIGGEQTKMRFGVVGMGNIDGFHTFHLHGHRWIIPGPDGNNPNAIQNSIQNTAVSQFEDTRTFGPANSFSFTMNPTNSPSFMRALPPGLGEWHMHCHVLTHMMDGMMGSLLIIKGGELALGLPVGEPCPEMGVGHNGKPPPGMTVKIKDFLFDPANVTLMTGQTVTWQWDVATAHSTTSDTGIWDSGVKTGIGTTFPKQFTSPGTFPYHCSLHGGAGGAGMSGTVTVM